MHLTIHFQLFKLILGGIILPRKARKTSSTSIYHVVIRGLDRQIMFECRKDYEKYLDILSLYKQECHFELYAYCLMSNHVHLLIKPTDISLETVFRKINTHYAVWFNMKYQRVGHLQQERFYSVPVEDESYFVSVIKYIHSNPQKAGLESSPGVSYIWSSMNEYLNNDYNLIDSPFVFGIIKKDDLLFYAENDSDLKHLDIDTVNKRLPDDVAMEIICNITENDACCNFHEINLTKKNYYIKEFYKNGISIRQINRLTGISRGIIQRVINT